MSLGIKTSLGCMVHKHFLDIMEPCRVQYKKKIIEMIW